MGDQTPVGADGGGRVCLNGPPGAAAGFELGSLPDEVISVFVELSGRSSG